MTPQKETKREPPQQKDFLVIVRVLAVDSRGVIGYECPQFAYMQWRCGKCGCRISTEPESRCGRCRRRIVVEKDVAVEAYRAAVDNFYRKAVKP